MATVAALLKIGGIAEIVAAWQQTPAPALRALADQHDQAHPAPAFDGDTAAFRVKARKATVAERGPLLRALVGPKSADTLARSPNTSRHPAQLIAKRATARSGAQERAASLRRGRRSRLTNQVSGPPGMRSGKLREPCSTMRSRCFGLMSMNTVGRLPARAARPLIGDPLGDLLVGVAEEGALQGLEPVGPRVAPEDLRRGDQREHPPRLALAVDEDVDGLVRRGTAGLADRWRVRKLKALGCFAGKNSAFIVPGVDLCQQIECGIQYTLSRSSPIAASLAARGTSGIKKLKAAVPKRRRGADESFSDPGVLRRPRGLQRGGQP